MINKTNIRHSLATKQNNGPDFSLLGQSGSVMFFSLVLLMVLSIYGLSAVRGALTEEKISINIQDRHLANEGAQSALRYAEQKLADFPNTFDEAYYATLSGEAAPDLANWETGAYQVSPDDWISDTPAPMYKLEYFAAPSASLETANGANITQQEVISTAYYRVLGYGQGKTDTASAIIEGISIKK